MSDLSRFLDLTKLPRIPDEGLSIGDLEITEPFGRRGEIWFGEYRFCIRRDGRRILDIATMENYLFGGAIIWDPNPDFNKDYFITEIAKAERSVYQRYKNSPKSVHLKYRPREWLITSDNSVVEDEYVEEEFPIEESPESLAGLSCSPLFQNFTRLMAYNDYADISLVSEIGQWSPAGEYSDVAFYVKYEPSHSPYIYLNDIISDLFFRTSKFKPRDLLLPR